MEAKTNKISIIVEAYLNPPFEKSLGDFNRIMNVWGMRILKASTNARISIISIPLSSFMLLLGEKPRIDSEYVITKAQGCLQKIKVKEINGD